MKIPTTCWYCGKEMGVEEKRGARCSSCGATWSPLPETGSVALTLRPDYGTRRPSGSPIVRRGGKGKGTGHAEKEVS